MWILDGYGWSISYPYHLLDLAEFFLVQNYYLAALNPLFERHENGSCSWSKVNLSFPSDKTFNWFHFLEGDKVNFKDSNSFKS